MLELAFPPKKNLSLLCLGAHCDDIEIGTGGTLLKLISEYKINSINWVIFTSNDIRKPEATLSAELFTRDVERTNIHINSWKDGFLPTIESELKIYFEELKKSIQPDIIFTHYRNDRHQDHRLVSNLTWNTWRNHLILEYEIPKYDGDLGVPNFFVPLEEEYIQKRNTILLDSFQSQKGKHWFDDDTFRALPRLRGMESATLFAEAFYARKIVFNNS